ncbi:MAG: hypothetical protein FWG58_04795 [Methanomassiliicoccaceae archaeon]|nr:hypothetical protein [Methanomassiliicoccaceae archaeon]
MNDLVMKGKSVLAGGTFGEVKIDGISVIEGDVACDKMEMDGIIDVKGNVSVNKRTDVDGICKISGNVNMNDLDFDGCLSVSGDVTAENANIEGLLTVDGTLNAGTIILKFHGASCAKEVVGGVIRIYRGIGLKQFRTELIEGDTIDIEQTRAKIVRGDSIVIGKGCVIGKAEYRTDLEIHQKAKVKERIKLN